MGTKLHTIFTFAILFISLSSHLLQAAPVHNLRKETKHLEENKISSFLHREMKEIQWQENLKGFRLLQEGKSNQITPTHPEPRKRDEVFESEETFESTGEEGTDDLANKDERNDLNGNSETIDFGNKKGPPQDPNEESDASDLDPANLNDGKNNKPEANNESSANNASKDDETDNDEDEDAGGDGKGKAEELARKPQMTDQENVNFNDVSNVYLIAILVILILLCIGCMGKMIYDFSRRVEGQYDHKELEDEEDFDEIEMSHNSKSTKKIETDDSRAEEEKESPIHAGKNKRNHDY